MFTASDIITQARIRLADDSGQKWPDARILYLFNEALEELALRTRLFVVRGYAPVRNNTPFYNFGTRVLKLSRVAYKDSERCDSIEIPFLAHSQMDELSQSGDTYNSRYRSNNAVSPYGDFGFRIGTGWDGDTGPEPLAVVVSNQQPGNFRLYPIPTFPPDSTTAMPIPLQGSGEEGVVDGVSALAANPIDTIEVDELMPFGTVTANLPPKYIAIHYIEVPVRAEALTQQYDYNPQYKKPIENYIVAKALRDQTDAYDPERAVREWAYFEEAIEQLEDQRSNDFRGPTTVDLSPNWIG